MKRMLILFIICSCVALLLLFISAVVANADERPVIVEVLWEEDPDLFFQAQCVIISKSGDDVIMAQTKLFNDLLSESPPWAADETVRGVVLEFSLDDDDMLTFQVEASKNVDFGIMIHYDGRLFGVDCQTYGYCYVAFRDLGIR